MTDETADQRHARLTADKFEALGVYVQEFEMMVEWMRYALYTLIIRQNDAIGARQQSLLAITFHHQSMTAGALFQIFRAIASSVANDAFYKVTAPERTIINEILAQLGKEVPDACAMRNTLLHGTWFIGARAASDTDFTEIHGGKLKVGATGLRESESFPKNIAQLQAEATKCKRLGAVIRDLTICMMLPLPPAGASVGGGSAVSRTFEKVDGSWSSKMTDHG